MEKNSRSSKIIRIAIVGPESTGKSTLTQELASHYKTEWVPEYARTYLTEKVGKYEYNDLEIIAKKQVELEDYFAFRAQQIVFCDTNLTVLKVWSEFVFNKLSDFIKEENSRRKYDLILLTNIDIPWEFDRLREHPNKREELFQIYKNELDTLKCEYRIISGDREKRLKDSISIINTLFKNELT